jgi:hypothetical protein
LSSCIPCFYLSLGFPVTRYCFELQNVLRMPLFRHDRVSTITSRNSIVFLEKCLLPDKHLHQTGIRLMKWMMACPLMMTYASVPSSRFACYRILRSLFLLPHIFYTLFLRLTKYLFVNRQLINCLFGRTPYPPVKPILPPSSIFYHNGLSSYSLRLLPVRHRYV